MVDECENSGLPKAWCSHCKPQVETQPVKRGVFRRSVDHFKYTDGYDIVKVAAFDSRCPQCDDTIEAGDQITETDDGWIHKECE